MKMKTITNNNIKNNLKDSFYIKAFFDANKSKLRAREEVILKNKHHQWTKEQIEEYLNRFYR